jgi:hypothetical protein
MFSAITDVAGQQAFLFSRSAQRFPSYQQWIGDRHTLQWRGGSESTIWTLDRGKIFSELGEIRG